MNMSVEVESMTLHLLDGAITIDAASGLVSVLIEGENVDVKLAVSDGDIDASAALTGSVYVTDLLNWNVTTEAYVKNKEFEGMALTVDIAMVTESLTEFCGYFDQIHLSLMEESVLDATAQLDVAVFSLLDMSVGLTAVDVSVDSKGVALLLGDMGVTEFSGGVQGEASVAVHLTDLPERMDAHLTLQEGGYTYVHVAAAMHMGADSMAQFEVGMPLLQVVVADQELMAFDMYMHMDGAAE
jgi:hypothetical protein